MYYYVLAFHTPSIQAGLNYNVITALLSSTEKNTWPLIFLFLSCPHLLRHWKNDLFLILLLLILFVFLFLLIFYVVLLLLDAIIIYSFSILVCLCWGDHTVYRYICGLKISTPTIEQMLLSSAWWTITCWVVKNSSRTELGPFWPRVGA